MALSDTPPGLWSVRNSKRHAAVARDTLVITARLDDLAFKTASIDSKLDKILLALSKSSVNDDNTHFKGRVCGNDVAERVTHMEMLLLRTSMEDFKVLDRQIVALLPTMTSTDATMLGVGLQDDQPEFEQSPDKVLEAPSTTCNHHSWKSLPLSLEDKFD